jgi:hypothetical protein
MKGHESLSRVVGCRRRQSYILELFRLSNIEKRRYHLRRSSNNYASSRAVLPSSGGSRGSKNKGIGPVYIALLFLQRGQLIGCFSGGLWRIVRPNLWSVAKILGRETLRTVCDILVDIGRSFG